MSQARCAACNAYGWHTEDCPVAAREVRSTDKWNEGHAFGFREGYQLAESRAVVWLDVERLALAMAMVQGVRDPYNSAPSWEGFAVKVAAAYARLSTPQRRANGADTSPQPVDPPVPQ